MTTSKDLQQYSLPIRRPVATAMVFLSLLVFGWKSYDELAINLMPDISYPTLTVRTEYEGAAPEDVEKLLTRPLEEILSTVSGMVEISSTSSPGLSEIVLEFGWDTDMSMAQQEVRERLDLFTPPEGVTENPVILRYDPTLDPIMRVAITGSPYEETDDPALRRQRIQEELTIIRDVAERHIKSDLEGELGIAQVLVKGGREEEIQILVDNELLKGLGLPLSAIVNALNQQNINLSGGSLREGKTEYLVRTLNEFQTVEEIRRTIVPNPAGRGIRLEEVANVRMGQKDQKTLVRLNGREAVELAIFKWGDANTVEVANKVKDLLGLEREESVLLQALSAILARMPFGPGAADQEYEEELAATVQSRLPDFAKMTVMSDQSEFIVAAISEVRGTAITGGILALIVLFFFLKELRTTLIIGVSIPISIVATFVPMYLWDVSLNIMSLGGLALGVGMLVDDSIIVLESIFRCMEEGDDPIAAADRGVREVRSADASSTFTTIAVFLPITFVEGIAGQMFMDLALTVTFSLLASLLVALYLIPMLAAQRGFLSNVRTDAVWMTRAYREARASGAGRVGALLQLPSYTLRYGKSWLRSSVRTTFGPAARTIGRARAEKNSTLERVLAPLLLVLGLVQLLLLSLLFLGQTILALVFAVFITLFFPVLLVLAGAIYLLGKIIWAIVWLPVNAFDKGFNTFRDVYTHSLRMILPLGPILLLVVIAVAVHAALLLPQIGRELIPPMKQGEFGIRMEAPPGTPLYQTAEQARAIEQQAMAIPEIGTVGLAVGQEEVSAERERGENIAEFTIRLKDPGKNVERQDEIMEELRVAAARATRNELAFTLPTLFSFKTAVELQIRGDDLDSLRRIGAQALARVEDVPGVRDADLSLREGYPEVIIEPDRILMAEHGLNPGQVGDLIRREVLGETATRFSRGGEKIDIVVRTDRDRLQSVGDLRDLSVREGSPPLPLSAVAQIEVQEGPSEIRRVGQRRTVLITANIEGRDLGAVTEDIAATVTGIEMPLDYQLILGGQNRELQTSYQSLQFALLLALFLVYVVMACQFESIHQPALVMFSVPLAFIGVIYALAVLNISLSIVVFIGGIVLAGVVVNDSIILVDYINQLRARGMTKRDAVVQAGRVRLRPIMITTLTTVLGLIPMAMQGGEGAEIRSPMAVTIIAGLSSATLLTLVVIPIIYDVFGGGDPRPAEQEAE